MKHFVLDHRPWPLPQRPWLLAMRWSELLFLHWPLEPAVLRSRLPRGLELDTYDGAAWIGVVPFRMTGVRPRWVPPLPGVSAFLELNLRTYVRAGGKPGVWFFSLDAASRLAVRAARRGFHLPYFDARMALEAEGETIRYGSVRIHRGAPRGCFDGRYRPVGPVFRSAAGSLEEWLTERYCLYAVGRRDRLYRGEIHHAPWPLQPAEVDLVRNSVPDSFGIDLPMTAPLAHYSRQLDVVAWGLESV